MGGERFAPDDPGAIAHTSSAPASLTRPLDNKSKLNLRLPTTTAVGAGAMIFKSIVGAGLFGLPWAFQQMGIGGALIASVVIAGLTLYSGLVLVRVHDVVVRDTLKRDLTYVSLTEYCFGRTVGGIVYFLVIFTSLGSQGAYLIFIGSVLNSLWPVLSTQAYAGIVAVAMVPFVLLRDMSFLAVTSQLGNVGVAIVVATTVWRGAQMSTIGPPAAYVWFDPSNFMGAFGVIGFLYSCSTSLITIEKAMARRPKFAAAYFWTSILTCAACSAFAVVMYLFYGACTQDMIVLNLGGGPLAMTAKLAIVLDLMFSYPISGAAAREIVEKSLLSNDTPHLERKRDAIRITMTALTYLVAWVPSFSVVLNIVGGWSVSALSFTLPCLMLVQLRRFHLRAYSVQTAFIEQKWTSHGSGAIAAAGGDHEVRHSQSDQSRGGGGASVHVPAGEHAGSGAGVDGGSSKHVDDHSSAHHGGYHHPPHHAGSTRHFTPHGGQAHAHDGHTHHHHGGGGGGHHGHGSHGHGSGGGGGGGGGGGTDIHVRPRNASDLLDQAAREADVRATVASGSGGSAAGTPVAGTPGSVELTAVGRPVSIGAFSKRGVGAASGASSGAPSGANTPSAAAHGSVGAASTHAPPVATGGHRHSIVNLDAAPALGREQLTLLAAESTVAMMTVGRVHLHGSHGHATGGGVGGHPNGHLPPPHPSPGTTSGSPSDVPYPHHAHPHAPIPAGLLHLGRADSLPPPAASAHAHDDAAGAASAPSPPIALPATGASSTTASAVGTPALAAGTAATSAAGSAAGTPHVDDSSGAPAATSSSEAPTAVPPLASSPTSVPSPSPDAPSDPHRSPSPPEQRSPSPSPAGDGTVNGGGGIGGSSSDMEMVVLGGAPFVHYEPLVFSPFTGELQNAAHHVKLSATHHRPESAGAVLGHTGGARSADDAGAAETVGFSAGAGTGARDHSGHRGRAGTHTATAIPEPPPRSGGGGACESSSPSPATTVPPASDGARAGVPPAPMRRSSTLHAMGEWLREGLGQRLAAASHAAVRLPRMFPLFDRRVPHHGHHGEHETAPLKGGSGGVSSSSAKSSVPAAAAGGNAHPRGSPAPSPKASPHDVAIGGSVGAAGVVLHGHKLVRGRTGSDYGVMGGGSNEGAAHAGPGHATGGGGSGGDQHHPAPHADVTDATAHAHPHAHAQPCADGHTAASHGSGGGAIVPLADTAGAGSKPHRGSMFGMLLASGAGSGGGDGHGQGHHGASRRSSSVTAAQYRALYSWARRERHTVALQLLGVGNTAETAFLLLVATFGVVVLFMTTISSIQSAVGGSASNVPPGCPAV